MTKYDMVNSGANLFGNKSTIGPKQSPRKLRLILKDMVCKTFNKTAISAITATHAFLEEEGGAPVVVVSTAAFHAGVRGSVPGLGGLKETRARISNHVSGGQCHLNHLTILRRFSWPSLAYIWTKVV